ncbi:MAG: prepilin-type N-terminal cleavage/methylation domain-containing protein, partial [Clostridia bacterium]|nr:prepilin-type N-terminal cleavage/methylation domain-containing protein [Clostridia bacterium]
MMRKFLQKLKNDSGGFSLIEVLVAIVILGVIVVPVCQGIVNSV